MGKYNQHTLKFPVNDKGSWSTAVLVDLGAELNTLHVMHMEGIKEELRKRAGVSGNTLQGRERVAAISALSDPSDKTDWKTLAQEALADLSAEKQAELIAKHTKPGAPSKQRVLFK